MTSDTPLQWIGLWIEEPHDIRDPQRRLKSYWEKLPPPRYPHPKHLVGAERNPAHKAALVAYLRSGTIVTHCLGYSYCRFEGGPSDQEMGSGDLSDGVWIWPEGLWVYVEHYDVRLPDEFETNVQNMGYRISVSEHLEDRGTDDSFWTSWSKRVAPMKWL